MKKAYHYPEIYAINYDVMYSKTANDFDPRNYGFAKLNELITAVGLFEVERRETRIFVRNNRKKLAS